MPPIQVHRIYLELRTPADLRPKAPVPGTTWLRLEALEPARYRQLYRDVGERWHWQDRRSWTDAEIAAHLARREISVWILRAADEDAGFVEMERHRDGATEIVYFGLLVPFIGRGLGAEMLTRAVRSAFDDGASRVWLHTCSLDSPMALPNYRARGFREFRDEWYTTEVEPPPS